MNQTRKTFEQLSREVAKAVDPAPDDKLRALQLGSLLATVPRHRRRIRARTYGLLAGAAAAISVIAFWGWAALSRTEDAPVDFWVGRLPVKGETGLGLSAGEGEVVPIQFAGGSELELRGNTSVRVAKASRPKVVVELHRGVLFADINRNGETEWIIRSGAYRVIVMGTSFSIEWHPEREEFRVEVIRGNVRVTGPRIDERGMQLGAGQTLSRTKDVSSKRSPDAPVSEPILNDATSRGRSAGESEPTPTRTAEHSAEPQSPRRHVKGTSQPPIEPLGVDADTGEPSSSQALSPFEALLAQGDFTGAMDAAEGSGLKEISSHAPLDTLWQLADAARYSKRPASAATLLKAVRRRAPGTQLAGTAAFVLGKLALETEDTKNAAVWFEIYLDENPDGPMAEESLGRLIWVHRDSGNRDAARSAAERYMRLYPGGPFDSIAHAVLNAPKDEEGR